MVVGGGISIELYVEVVLRVKAFKKAWNCLENI